MHAHKAAPAVEVIADRLSMPPANDTTAVIDLAEAQFALLGAVQTIEDMLHFALVVQSSPAMRAALLQGEPALRLDYPDRAGHLVVTPGRATVSADAFTAPAAARHYGDAIADAATRRLAASEDADGALRRRAAALTACVVTDERRLIEAIAAWLPLIEPALYRLAERIVAVLDGLRLGVALRCARDGHADSGAQMYASLVAALRRAMLLATDGGAPWLAARLCADASDGAAPSPSFTLIREGDVDSVLAGARVAARIGSVVVPGYLRRLRKADQPRERLDAIVALTAIGLARPVARPGIAADLQAIMHDLAGRRPDSSVLIDLAGCSALQALQRADAQIQSWPPDAGAPSARDCDDAFARASDGTIAVFAMLDIAVSADLAQLIRILPGSKATGEEAARRAFARAWLQDKAGPGEGGPPGFG